MARKLSEREKWFKDRIGKRVFRNKTTCKCVVCVGVYQKGLYIHDEMHAIYVCDMEGVSNHEGNPLKYFDTVEERDEFERELEHIYGKNHRQ